MSNANHATVEELNKKFEMLPLKKKIEIYQKDIIAETRQLLFFKHDEETRGFLERILKDKLCKLGKYEAEYEASKSIKRRSKK